MRVVMLAVAAIAGCMNTGNTTTLNPGAPVKARYLCVGMEYSNRFGSCPGCEKDAERLSSLMNGTFGYRGETLISEKATRESVSRALKEGVDATPEDGLFLFFYSGHGGQERLGGKEPDGADAMDEYICLYDSHMLDDEIWSIVSKCRGRVFLYFDACHSATMYRSVSSELRERSKRDISVAEPLSVPSGDVISSRGFTFRPERFVKARAMDLSSPSPRMLCWSGCRETEYSYGGTKGGFLTLAVLNGWSKGCSYGKLWDYASGWVRKVQPDQNPVRTYIGSGFSDGMEAFR